MPIYSFDAKVAATVGVDAAIILHAMDFWISKNEANGRNQYDGNTWTYNSVASWEKIFPFWTRPQITRRLQKMMDDGLIVSGNYNNNSYDRTLWYAFTDIAKSILRNREMENTESLNRNDEIAKPIPFSKPVIKTVKERVPNGTMCFPDEKHESVDVCPYKKIIDLYHEKLPMLPRVRMLTDMRKRFIRCRWQNELPNLDTWGKYFTDVGKSKFLIGQVEPMNGRRPFLADIDFLIRPSTVVKMSEGKYHRK